MIESQIHCSDDSLKAILQEELHADASDAVLAHVEKCTHCQQRVTELAASADDWSRLPELIDDSRIVDTGSYLPEFPHLGQRPIHWTESMARQLLSPATHPEMLGRLGRYEVERLIGCGGMGVVFKAYDSELNRPVAIKLLAPYLAASGPARKRFSREARAAAAVVHQHVVPIHNVETERDAPFIVMQYVSGESLQERIDRQGPLELCEILRIGMQVADGLSAAHQQGLVHRDIKPSNILLEEDVDRALISDFGLARASDDATLTRPGFHPGTPQYMSPEQASGQHVDARSDLFSLGSMLYTMCTGRPPFRAENSLGVMRGIADSEPVPIREINPQIPDWLCALISQLMAKDRSQRIQTAALVHELLESCLNHVQQPTVARLPAIPGGLPQPLKTSFLKSSMGVLCMVSLFSILAIAGFMMSSADSVADKLAGIKGIDGHFHEMTDDDVRVVVYSVSAAALGTDRPAAVCDFGTGRIALLNQDVKYPRLYHSHKVKISGEQPQEGRSLFRDKSNAFRFAYKDGVADCEFIDFKFQYQDGQIVIVDNRYAFNLQESPGPLLIVDRASGAVTVSRLKPESERVASMGSELPVEAVSTTAPGQPQSDQDRDGHQTDVKRMEQTYEITDSAKAIGKRHFTVESTGSSVTISDEALVTLNVAEIGCIFERDIQAEYRWNAGVPVLSRIVLSAKDAGDPVVKGTATIANGKAEMEWSSYHERGHKLDKPTQHSSSAMLPEGPILLPETVQTIGPVLLPQEGNISIVWATLDNSPNRSLLKTKTGWRLQRQAIAGGGFELLVIKPNVDKPDMRLQFDSNGVCERIVMGGTTVMTPVKAEVPNPPAEVVPHEHPESILNTKEPKPVTWKSLLGTEPPAGYPADMPILIEGLNNSRGDWGAAVKVVTDEAVAEVEAVMQVQGGFQSKVKEGRFPQWQIAISWPREKPTSSLRLNVMVLPEPDAVKLLLIPLYVVDGKPLPGKHKTYNGVWNAKRSTVKWTPQRIDSITKGKEGEVITGDDARQDHPDSFEMTVHSNGDLGWSAYRHNDSNVISSKSAVRIGKPFVEKQPSLEKLPNGYKVFFAGRSEVYIVTKSGESVIGPRVDTIGCDGDLIFGRIIKYEHVPENTDMLGYFWVDTKSGQSSKGLELSAWRDVLKSKGVTEPRLVAPDEVNERY